MSVFNGELKAVITTFTKDVHTQRPRRIFFAVVADDALQWRIKIPSGVRPTDYVNRMVYQLMLRASAGVVRVLRYDLRGKLRTATTLDFPMENAKEALGEWFGLSVTPDYDYAYDRMTDYNGNVIHFGDGLATPMQYTIDPYTSYYYDKLFRLYDGTRPPREVKAEKPMYIGKQKARMAVSPMAAFMAERADARLKESNVFSSDILDYARAF